MDVAEALRVASMVIVASCVTTVATFASCVMTTAISVAVVAMGSGICCEIIMSIRPAMNNNGTRGMSVLTSD